MTEVNFSYAERRIMHSCSRHPERFVATATESGARSGFPKRGKARERRNAETTST
ncbi:hypothetical protein EZV77_10375 [Burkholderia thailandensis]|nr:hypothetical protein A8H32_28860 [Burkholderia thailandensis]MDD1481470.1 hypothetical protein [Burkholderia thailandensis]MDD1484913.1 hypothetical protein [Burkholderia thailandensis]MDD1491623.1 hypothetical protein [Burkholderia thailandensis]PJO72981.1 hypothetical protein CWD92_07445 [Burkholderia thailandensis]